MYFCFKDHIKVKFVTSKEACRAVGFAFKVLIELDKLISTQKEKCKNLRSGGKYKKNCCIERRGRGELES